MNVMFLLIFIAVGAAYFYYNWQFFTFFDACFGRRKKLWVVFSVFFINYAIFTICSILQSHLILNWTIFFFFLLAETHLIYRQTWTTDLYMALSGVVPGLALNIVFRCSFALLLNKPLMLFDNQVMTEGNLKQYPVLFGFVVAGAVFQLVRRKGMPQKIKELMEDRFSLKFLVRIVLILYAYLILNLLTYYTGGNEPILKLWGLKSAIFVMLGLFLASAYSIRMSGIRQYIDLNRKEHEALLREKEEEEKLRIIAYTDLLTGCYNRQYAEEALAEIWESQKRFSLCFVDLNGLKNINDQYGHLDGDQYLVTVARTLEKYIREGDCLFRYGGDEFLILFLEPKGNIPLQRMHRVNQELSEYCRAKGSRVMMSVSWGLAAREEGDSISELLQLADERMYQNKQTMHLQRG